MEYPQEQFKGPKQQLDQLVQRLTQRFRSPTGDGEPQITTSYTPVKRGGLSRRNFVKGLGLLAALPIVGEFTKFTAFAGEPIDESERPSNKEQKEVSKTITCQETEINGKRTFVFADRLAFYTHAPDPAKDFREFVPTNNTGFYNKEARKGDHFGFAGGPSFFVIHTDGGNNVVNTVAGLDANKIGCQFSVGIIDDEPVSIQSNYLTNDRININGTVAASPENDFKTNFQYWSSLNVEIEGQPDNIDDRLYDKVVELALKTMPLYDLKISQIIGHMEVPNNGKVDPGRAVLKEIRTRIYLALMEAGHYDLIDILPDNKEALKAVFDVTKTPSGPAKIAKHNERVKSWLPDYDSFVDWKRIEAFLENQPEMVEKIHDESPVVVNINVEDVVTSEVWIGIPASFVEWLMSSGKPLEDEKYNQSCARFIQQLCNFHTTGFIDGKRAKFKALPKGAPLPYTYAEIKNLADLFLEVNPYQNRGNEVADCLVNLCEELNPSNFYDNLLTLQKVFTEKYNQSLKLV